MPANKRILKLKGKVQHYAWGGFHYIPELLRLPNPDNKPFAEYWMGAHTGAPSEVEGENTTALLHHLIESEPEAYLGAQVWKEFGELPYLFKILDVKDMLSIQVHPTRDEAVKGYEAEEAAGIPLNAPHRNYKDKNHKPEVMVALSDFWLLHGFKQQDELTRLLEDIPEFSFLVPVFGAGNYRELYKTVMELSAEETDTILLPLVQRELERKDTLLPRQPGFWVNKLFVNGAIEGTIDKGVFSIYFFNIVQLQPGDAIFQSAGIPHAYLHGQNVELMANSDNVLRGGLTPKHVDVPELLKHTLFKGVQPKVLRGESSASGEIHYHCPVKDFGISAIDLKHGHVYHAESNSAEILIVIEGQVRCADTNMHFSKGESLMVLPATQYSLEAVQPSLLYKAFVPQHH